MSTPDTAGSVAPDKLAMSIDAFCEAHDICRASFYNLRNRGQAPATMRVGSRILISYEAAARWRAEMEADSQGPPQHGAPAARATDNHDPSSPTE